jgi:hypothetical protein
MTNAIRSKASPQQMPAPAELVVLFSTVLKQGIVFRPRLVAFEGQIVGRIPGPIDRGLMRMHRLYKETEHR